MKKARRLTLSSEKIPEELSDIALFLNRVESNREMIISFTKIGQGRTETIIKNLKNRIKADADNYEFYHLLAFYTSWLVEKI